MKKRVFLVVGIVGFLIGAVRWARADSMQEAIQQLQSSNAMQRRQALERFQTVNKKT